MDKAQEKEMASLIRADTSKYASLYVHESYAMVKEILLLIEELGYRKPLDRPELREALKRDFRKLYVKEFSTTWELERVHREVEIDIMDLSNTLALIVPKDSVVLDKDLAEQIFAQICGIRMREPTDYKSALDDSYERLKALLRS